MSALAHNDCRAVLFDAAHTLFDVQPSVGDVYARAARRYGIEVSGAFLDTLFSKHWNAMRRIEPHTLETSEERERAWWKALVRQVFAEAPAAEALDGRFEAFFSALWEVFAHPDVWHVHADVVPALGTLRECGVRCAIVSNWDARLHRLVAALRLEGYFEFVLTSAEAGWRKPDPRIFNEALRRLEVPRETVLHVGDSLEDDVAGARAAGIAAVLLDRQARHPGHVPRITSLAGLAGLCGE